MKRLKVISLFVFFIICTIAGGWFLQDNSAATELTLFGFYLGVLPLGIWLAITFGLGIAVALLATVVSVGKVRYKLVRLEKELNCLKSTAL